MSYPVSVTVQVDGGSLLTDFRSLTITQELFTHHTFAIDFSFEALGKALGIKPELLFREGHEQLSGKNITISWHGALPEGMGRIFSFKGLITETSIQTSADLANYYHISGTSPDFLLADGSQSRSFVKKTVQQIFDAVLTGYPANALTHEFKPHQTAVLPYVAQYDETNFNFLSRVAAQQGEWFYYDGTTVRLGLGEAKQIAFQSDASQSFTLTMNLQPNQLQGGYYNYRAHQPLKATGKAPTGGDAFSAFAIRRSKEVFTQPHRLLADSVLTTDTQLQHAMDTLAAKQTSGLVVLEGQGEACDMIPGSPLSVRDAAGVDYGQFRVLAVEHDLDGDGNYQNRFKAMPGTLDSPPPNEFYATPAAHAEVAEVVDLADPRHLGRVRVRFKWLVDKPQDAESGWLRVTTPYSGDGKGQMFTPEVGSQVLVSYEHGLPEFPVVVGNVFHAQNKQSTKYSPANNFVKGLQTSGGNKFVMVDTKDDQKILISNSNNKDTAIEVGFKGDGSITIKSNGPVTVLSPNITLEAGKEGTIKLHAKTITMEAEDDIAAMANNKGISLKAGENIELEATEQLNTRTKEQTIITSSKLQINGGANIDVKAGTVKINS